MPRATSGRRSTIYDIAQAADASPSTVSLVLNGDWTRYRIRQDTAKRILKSAKDLGYAVNLKARGLRLSRSGLAGMIVPHHRNRFFAGMIEAFEEEARRRDLCPIVVSTKRDAGIETSVTETMLAQQVEFLFIAGVRDPRPLNVLCAAAAVPCVNLDLPGEAAPSVVSDNRGGAASLTRILLEKTRARGGSSDDLFFLGGFAGEYATDGRIAGFRAAIEASGAAPAADAVDCCGYRPQAARDALERRCARTGRPPGGLFVNSITTLEGALQFTASLAARERDAIAIGCFDWDPFAAHLPLDVTMLRQNVEAMIAEAFSLVEAPPGEANPLVVVPTEFSPGSDAENAFERSAAF